MRLAIVGGAVAVVAVVAIVGGVVAKKFTGSNPASAVATAPSEPAAPPPPKAPPPVVTNVAPPAATASASANNQVVAQAPAAPPPAAATPAPAAIPTAAPPPPAVNAGADCPGNPNALGISRVVEIDTTGGPGFGMEHFKSHDFLREGEVVLTFDDGPWLNNTPKVLAALAANCTKAIFFPMGLHATYYPDILRQVAAAGHTVGSHTWSHQDLTKAKGKFKENGKTVVKEFDPKDEIEKGISAVRWAVQGPTAPFFRFPDLRHPPAMVEYLGTRNISTFSADFDSQDFKMKKPEQVIQSVMTKLKKYGKGIILMHDFQHATADAMPELLRQMKAGGYKVVFVRAKDTLTTLPAYDEMVLKDQKLPTVSDRPTSSVVHTISGD